MLVNLAKLVILANVTNMARFHQIVKHINYLNTGRPNMLANLAILANVTFMAKFHQIAKLM